MNVRIIDGIARGLRDERGLTTVEYVIVLCLIASVAVGTWQQFGSKVHEYLQGAERDIDAAMTTE